MADAENRLARETSPYLLQHAHDPVDWFPYGEEAFARARELDRPLFFSIGYSACHWCHVMGHESFADEATAAEMNETVVAVKVDREERPDVDAVYMEAVQAATGSGGWPMSVFATPEGKPFFAGTYFPDRPRQNMPSFRQVVAAVGDVWANRRDDVLAQADALSGAVAERLGAATGARRGAGGEAGAGGLDAGAVSRAVEAACARLGEIADPVHGGFGLAPKFPQPLLLDLLLRAHVAGLGGAGAAGDAAGGAGGAPIGLVSGTLEAMCSGGIWDHLGGGFARYAVDREWIVPHFEKMLYDQALLGRVLLHLWQCTGDLRWHQVLAELIEYVLGDLGLAGGALAASEDADSEGEEGRFYLWERAELDEILGPDVAAEASEWWGVTAAGNFEGRTILHRPVRGDLVRPPDIETARGALLAARAGRVRPGRDDKVLAEWNAMMCATLAEAALATADGRWAEAAARLGEVLQRDLRRPGDGRVLRLPQAAGKADILGFSTDVAWMAEAFTRLAELTGDPVWAGRAVELATQLVELFEDPVGGGLFTTGHDAEALLVRPRETTDNVIPSGTSIGSAALARLAGLADRPELLEAARRWIDSLAPYVAEAPTAVPELLRAAELVHRGTVEVAVTGERADLVAAVAERFEPRVVLAWERPGGGAGAAGADGTLPILTGRPPGAAYVCRYGQCRLPAETVDELNRELDAALA